MTMRQIQFLRALAAVAPLVITSSSGNEIQNSHDASMTPPTIENSSPLDSSLSSPPVSSLESSLNESELSNDSMSLPASYQKEKDSTSDSTIEEATKAKLPGSTESREENMVVATADDLIEMKRENTDEDTAEVETAPAESEKVPQIEVDEKVEEETMLPQIESEGNFSEEVLPSTEDKPQEDKEQKSNIPQTKVDAATSTVEEGSDKEQDSTIAGESPEIENNLKAEEENILVPPENEEAQSDGGDLPEQEVEADESTCSIDPTSPGDCAVDTPSLDNKSPSVTVPATKYYHTDDATPAQLASRREIVSLTDENFDELTTSATPATWLIMFKTDACGICKKVMPVLEELAMDASILKKSIGESVQGEDNEDEADEGPIVIATVDARWSGRDTTKRFEIDATPTIIVLRNGGAASLLNSEGTKIKDEPRHFYIYRGQRAIYSMRQFILGGYKTRRKEEMPEPLPIEERKPHTFIGRTVDYFQPSVAWAGGLVIKLLLAWFTFLGITGCCMRYHNYAWDNDDEDGEDEGEYGYANVKSKSKAGTKPYKPESQEEASARRQRLIWERKAQNHAKFAANREARRKAKEEREAKKARGEIGDDDDDFEFEAVGRSVKKSEALQAKRERESKLKSKQTGRKR